MKLYKFTTKSLNFEFSGSLVQSIFQRFHRCMWMWMLTKWYVYAHMLQCLETLSFTTPKQESSRISFKNSKKTYAYNLKMFSTNKLIFNCNPYLVFEICTRSPAVSWSTLCALESGSHFSALLEMWVGLKYPQCSQKDHVCLWEWKG